MHENPSVACHLISQTTIANSRSGCLAGASKQTRTRDTAGIATGLDASTVTRARRPAHTSSSFFLLPIPTHPPLSPVLCPTPTTDDHVCSPCSPPGDSRLLARVRRPYRAALARAHGARRPGRRARRSRILRLRPPSRRGCQCVQSILLFSLRLSPRKNAGEGGGSAGVGADRTRAAPSQRTSRWRSASRRSLSTRTRRPHRRSPSSSRRSRRRAPGR